MRARDRPKPQWGITLNSAPLATPTFGPLPLAVKHTCANAALHDASSSAIWMSCADRIALPDRPRLDWRTFPSHTLQDRRTSPLLCYRIASGFSLVLLSLAPRGREKERRTVTLSWQCLRVHGGKHPRGSARRSATAPAAPAECDRLTILQKLDPRCLPAFGATKSPTDIAAAEIDKRYKSTCFII